MESEANKKPSEQDHEAKEDLWDLDCFKDRWSQRPLDMFLSILPIGCLLLQVAGNALGNGVRLLHVVSGRDSLSAFDLTRMANDFCTLVLNMLVICLWSALCFQTTTTLHLFRWKSWLYGNNTMSGLGFVPKPAAASVGLLLFLTGVFVKERVVKGEDLLKDDKKISGGELCRADVQEVSEYSAEWFSRMDRRIPAGCYFGETQVTGAGIPEPFSTILNGTVNLAHPFAVQGTSNTWFAARVASLVHGMLPQEMLFRQLHPRSDFESLFGSMGTLSNSTDTDYVCMYQCIKWKPWGFQDFVSKLGVVVAGAAVITKITESATSWLGVSRVTIDTSPKKLKDTLEKIGRKADETNPFYKSCACCAWILCTIRFGTMLVYKVDDHGFFTVDYYVSQTILFALLTSLLVRNYHPFYCVWLAYTDDMWRKGSDSFIIYDDFAVDIHEKAKCHCQVNDQDVHHCPHEAAQKTRHVSSEPRSIDIFTWLHLSARQRNYLLITYAQAVSPKPKESIHAQVKCLVPFQVEQYAAQSAQEDGQELGRRDSAVFRRLLDVKHGTKGKIVSMDGKMATVVWDDQAKSEGDSDQAGESGFWLKQEKMSSVRIDNLVDSGDEWDRLMQVFVGDPEVCVHMRRSILLKLKRSNTRAESPTFWHKVKNCFFCSAQPNDSIKENEMPLLP